MQGCFMSCCSCTAVFETVRFLALIKCVSSRHTRRTKPQNVRGVRKTGKSSYPPPSLLSPSRKLLAPCATLTGLFQSQQLSTPTHVPLTGKLLFAARMYDTGGNQERQPAVPICPAPSEEKKGGAFKNRTLALIGNFGRKAGGRKVYAACVL